MLTGLFLALWAVALFLGGVAVIAPDRTALAAHDYDITSTAQMDNAHDNVMHAAQADLAHDYDAITQTADAHDYDCVTQMVDAHDHDCVTQTDAHD